MPRRESSIIQTHEDFQTLTGYRDFIDGSWIQNMSQPLPDFSTAKNSIIPSINHSRWIIDCPALGCSNASVASKQVPYWICGQCGSPENDELWYNVDFPADAAELEILLLLRPERNRNNEDWSEGNKRIQILDEIKQENRDRDLPDR